MANKSPPSRKLYFVQEIERLADDNQYGYSQKPPSGRWGPDYDCSSLIYQAADNAGYPVGTGSDKVRFTGTMLKDFEKAGFQILPFANVGISDLKIGDILLNLALHAEVYVGEGQTVGATSSETGGFVGEAGDQTGHEIERHPVTTFDKEWDYVLRPPDDESQDELEEEGENEMAMNYAPNTMMPTQPWNNAGQPWGNNQMTGYPQGGMNGNMQGYGMNNRMMPNHGSNMQGYPQGNLGQMNGYSSANAGYPQGNMMGYGYPQGGQMNGYPQGNQMPMGPQGQPQTMETDYCFVKGYEGACNSYGMPNSRKPLFDEDKWVFYAVTYGPQGTPTDVHPYRFMDDFESVEEIPQHMSPLMRNNQSGNMGMGMNHPVGDFITRAEFEELKEMMNNESSSKQPNGGRNATQQPGTKLNARTN